MLNILQHKLPLAIAQKLFRIVLLLVAGEVAKKLVSLLARKIRVTPKGIQPTRGQEKRLKTITSLVVNTSKIAINFIVFIIILSELGINITPLITGAGILGLAVGFGAKSLVADIIAGFFILLENQFNVGDEIELGPWKGKVKKITLRTVTLKDENKKIYIIPNSSIKAVVKLPRKKSKTKS